MYETQHVISSRHTLVRSEAVVRILGGKSSVPLEAIRQGVTAEDIAEWVNVGRAAIAAAIDRFELLKCRDQAAPRSFATALTV